GGDGRRRSATGPPAGRNRRRTVACAPGPVRTVAVAAWTGPSEHLRRRPWPAVRRHAGWSAWHPVPWPVAGHDPRQRDTRRSGLRLPAHVNRACGFSPWTLPADLSSL